MRIQPCVGHSSTFLHYIPTQCLSLVIFSLLISRGPIAVKSSPKVDFKVAQVEVHVHQPHPLFEFKSGRGNYGSAEMLEMELPSDSLKSTILPS